MSPALVMILFALRLSLLVLRRLLSGWNQGVRVTCSERSWTHYEASGGPRVS